MNFLSYVTSFSSKFLMLLSILHFKLNLTMSRPSCLSEGNDAILKGHELYSSSWMCRPICLCVAVWPHLALNRSRTTQAYKCCISVYEQHHQLFALCQTGTRDRFAGICHLHDIFRWCFVQMSIAFCHSVTDDIPN